MSEWNVTGTKNGGTNGAKERDESQWLATPSIYTGLGGAIIAKLMISFWFGIGVILAIGVVDCLNYCIGALTSGR